MGQLSISINEDKIKQKTIDDEQVINNNKLEETVTQRKSYEKMIIELEYELKSLKVISGYSRLAVFDPRAPSVATAIQKR